MGHWWEGKAHDQITHKHINADHYPGTRQLCDACDEPTGRCEEDDLWVDDDGPFCEECYAACTSDTEGK